MKIPICFFVVVLGFEAVVAQSFSLVLHNSEEICNMFCDDNMEMAMKEHCKRGCRFAGLVSSSTHLELNSTAAQELCFDSCKEAYENASGKTDACLKGCEGSGIQDPFNDQAVSDIFADMEREAKNFELFASYIMSELSKKFSSFYDESGEVPESKEDFDDSREEIRIPYLNDALSKPNKNDMPDLELDVDVIESDGENILVLNGQATPAILSSPRNWIAVSMYGLLAALVLSIFLITVCVMVTRCVLSKRASKSARNSSPPSYENLVKNGFIHTPEFSNIKVPILSVIEDFDVHGVPETEQDAKDEKLKNHCV